MRASYQDHESQRAARGNVQLLRVLKQVLRVTWFGNYAKDSAVRRDVCCWVRGTFPPPLISASRRGDSGPCFSPSHRPMEGEHSNLIGQRLASLVSILTEGSVTVS